MGKRLAELEAEVVRLEGTQAEPIDDLEAPRAARGLCFERQARLRKLRD